MAARKARKKNSGVLRKVRKPMPPPTRVADESRKYSRARERERQRRSDRRTANSGESES